MLTKDQKERIIDHYVRGGSGKSILESDGGFDGVTRQDIEGFLLTMANALDQQNEANEL